MYIYCGKLYCLQLARTLGSKYEPYKTISIRDTCLRSVTITNTIKLCYTIYVRCIQLHHYLFIIIIVVVCFVISTFC